MKNKISKKIFILWYQGWPKAPYVVKKCSESWINKNKDWDIILLDKFNIKRYIEFEISKDVSIQAMSDIVRIKLLRKYGGIWVDASVYCNRPLNEYIFKFTRKTGFFAFCNPGKDRLISSWFLASSNDNYIISTMDTCVKKFWNYKKKEIYFRLLISKIFDYSYEFSKKIKTYNFFQKNIFFFKRTINKYPYFWMHYIFYYLYLKDKKFRQKWDSSYRFEASKPHVVKHWGSQKEVNNKFIEHTKKIKTPVYKLEWDIDLIAGTVTDFVLQGGLEKKEDSK